jgi:hypothetical protein
MTFVSGQESKDIYLKSLIDYRNELNKEISNGDLNKEDRCREKISEYAAKMRLYLQKIDSMEFVIKEKNQTGSGYFYFILFRNQTYYNWGECNTMVIKDSMKYERRIYTHTRDVIDSKFEIGKEDKWRIHLNGTTGQTYYREDIR